MRAYKRGFLFFVSKLLVYSTIKEACAGLTPFAFAAIRTSPACSATCTISVHCPEKRCIWGRWNASRLVASPLAVARKEPAPSTEN